MEELIIKNFLGKNTKASAFDIEHHQAQEIKNFEISKIIGSLIKSFGYEIATDMLGSEYTSTAKAAGLNNPYAIGNIFEWNTGRASPNDKLYIIWDSISDRIYYWDNTTGWVRLDDSATYVYDKVRFFERDNALIVSSGIGATNYPLFIKYFDARTILGAASANQAAGYYDGKLNDLAWNTGFSMEISKFADFGDLEAGWYYYYGCLVYDDVQNGNVGNMIKSVETLTDKYLLLKLSITSTNGDAINRRATHIKIFRSYAGFAAGDPFSDLDVPVTQPWTSSYLVATIPLDNDTDALHVNCSGEGTYTLSTLKVSGLSNLDVSNDMFIGFYLALWQSGGTKVYQRITDNDGTNFTLASGTGLTDGQTYLWEVVSYWWLNGTNYECYIADRTFALTTIITSDLNRSSQKTNPINFKYMLTHNKFAYYAPLYLREDSEEKKNVLGISNINGDGNEEYDVVRHFINLKDYGVEEITGFGKILNYIIIFTYNDLFKIDTSSGNIFSWSLLETLENVGCIAPDSLTFIWDENYKYKGWFYRSNDGYRVYDGYSSRLISIEIEESDSFPFEVTSGTEAIGEYNPVTKQWIVSYPTDSLIHKLDLLSGEWLEADYADEFDEFCLTRSDRLLGTDGSKIVVLTNDGSNNLTDHDGTAISPSWKSKVYNCQRPGIGKIAKFLAITYKSDTAIRFRWYLNRSTTPKDLNNALPAQTKLQTKVIGLPTSQRFDEIELELDLTTANEATNTDFQVDELRLGYLIDTIRK